MAELRPQLLAKADQAAHQIVRHNEVRPAIPPDARGSGVTVVDEDSFKSLAN